VSLLLARNPNDRPSVNQVLQLPLLRSRIKRFLSASLLQEEFRYVCALTLTHVRMLFTEVTTLWHVAVIQCCTVNHRLSISPWLCLVPSLFRVKHRLIAFHTNTTCPLLLPADSLVSSAQVRLAGWGGLLHPPWHRTC